MKKTLFLGQTFYRLCAFLFLGYIVYQRLLRPVLPKILYKNLYLNEHYVLIGLYGGIISIFIYAIIVQLKVIFNIAKKPNVVAEKLLVFSNKCYEAFDHFLREILFKEQIGNWIVKLGFFLITYLNGRRTYILTALRIVPKVIVLFFFVVDVFIFHKLCFVYKASPLLIVPLIINYIDYLMYNFCKNNLNILKDILCFYDNTQQKKIEPIDFVFAKMGMTKYNFIYSNQFSYSLTDAYIKKQNDISFDEESTIEYFTTVLFEEIVPISAYIMMYKYYYKERITPYFYLLFNSIYATCWIYILFYSF